MKMGIFNYKDKDYEVDSRNFLLDFNQWDENFAEGMALQLKIPHGSTKEHWDVIHLIRNTFQEMGRCRLVYEICRMSGLRIQDLRKLFPTGYLRGACKLAGITSRAGHLGPAYHPINLPETTSFMESYDKTYEVDVRGFLVNPDQWDEYYAIYKAYDMKIHGGKLTDKHWQIIRFLRENYKKIMKFQPFTRPVKRIRLILRNLSSCFPMDIIVVRLKSLGFGRDKSSLGISAGVKNNDSYLLLLPRGL
jgi:tRNA 2-thiouridine synthesizing protein E